MDIQQTMVVGVVLLILVLALLRGNLKKLRFKGYGVEVEAETPESVGDHGLNAVLQRIAAAELPSSQNAGQLFLEGKRLLEEGKHLAAKRLFDGVQPTSVDFKCRSLIEISRIYEGQGELSAAAKSLRDGIKLGSTDSEIIMELRRKLRILQQRMRVLCYLKRVKNSSGQYDGKIVCFSQVPSADDLARCLAALSNGNGGAILVGYNKDGESTGQFGAQVETVFDCAFFEKIDPVCICELVDNRLIVVEEGLTKPYHANGDCCLLDEKDRPRRAEKKEVQELKKWL